MTMQVHNQLVDYNQNKDVMTHISTRDQNTVSTLGMESLVFQDLVGLLKSQGIEVVQRPVTRNFIPQQKIKKELPPPQKNVYIPQSDYDEEPLEFDDVSSITGITELTDFLKNHLEKHPKNNNGKNGKGYTMDANFLLTVANQWYEQFTSTNIEGLAPPEKSGPIKAMKIDASLGSPRSG
eukprot:CAMPEP_0113322400 /NCGR_PEP_ID=MMETSP0010_2-20120614/15583_1 /TAXON_ID=216773 ORGANISM="Corethron hystrix, Strain 308" /NCGR_SAMPLE_ID=MMETSP0010_2 /ASSEMBLY_ACC=CAM_ASM_000155 /LENGTH=179 /DNA_ID=CAMNT_0000180893 /DNA_START=146 /DNA_END=682 /DNA_ORIENTATION=- /assembly_acc=CAM_ASM_000155